MAVHVDEIHTDVSTSASTPARHEDDGATADERWRESQGRTEWLARRVRAEGFSD